MPASGAGRHRLRNVLVVAQVACSLVVLVMAGLFVRSLARAQSVDLGIRPDHLLNVTMDPGQQGYDEARTASLYRDLLSRVRSLPGVESASLAHTVPFGYNDIGQRLEKEGQTLAPADRGVAANYNIVDADYQRTMGLEVIRGRWFTQAEQDDERPVVVVNEQLAARLWPGEHALGKRLRFRDVAGSPFLEVIGVTRTGKYNQVTERPRGFLYIPQTLEYKSLQVLHVRTTGRPDAVAPVVRRELASLAPDVPVWDVTTMQQWVDGYALFLRRAGAWFAGALGLLGLALAVVGLYGVVAYSARQRTHEIGIRMALGAGRGAILAMVVRQGARLVVAGGVAGTLMALAAGRLLSSLLFDIKPHDPLTYAAVAGLLAVAGGTAAFVPARRATRIDPTIALRGE
jgi:predicted permease